MRAAALVAILLVLPSAALGFNRSRTTADPVNGPCLYWSKMPVPFTLNQNGSKDAGKDASLTAARKSFATWTQPSCTHLQFDDKGTTARTDVGFDQSGNNNIDLIVWREVKCTNAAPSGDPCFSDGSCANKYNCWDQSDQTIAVTTTTYSNKTGEIFDADIELNGAGFVFTAFDGTPCPKDLPVPRPATCVATDVQNTLTHEIGHFIGLDHVNDPNTTMYKSASTGETSKRTLAQDDIDGDCAIYPAGEPPTTCGDASISVQGDGGGCNCNAGGGSVIGFMVPAGLMLLGIRLALRRRA